MGFFKKMFGGASSSSQKRTLVCLGCREQYDLDHIVTVSDDQAMAFLRGGGAVVVGEMSGHPVMVGHSSSATSKSDLNALLKEGPKFGWQCSKCKAKNSW